MDADFPRHLLLCETLVDSVGAARWRFVLHSIDSGQTLAASDHEPDAEGQRLELWAVVRGLEALAQPSRVALVSGSDYVRRGLDGGVAAWRAARWKWERFGRLVLVRDHDLWRRVDRALEIHQVEHRGAAIATAPAEEETGEVARPVPSQRRLRFDRSHAVAPDSFREPAVMIVRGRRGHSVRLSAPRDAAHHPLVAAS
ncbi:Ribonuclease HI [Pirellulimonas nuda]|uniref:Ribonuclease HI n=1 Tax=Pirellulimonas nuda TaxID=2528009 RepID=A0A518DHE9_9BACT|nr:RNase H family protein [Pirellulimonas nuda]QDU90872.1 Ribonuclease HI [Pirellulimonas nuda]